MDMVLKVIVNDGEEIIIDGFDKIKFYKDYPFIEISETGYTWHRDKYDELINNLIKYNFIEFTRANKSDLLEYRGNKFAFDNGTFSENEPLLIRTNCINMIYKMY